jgi:hypothetical protein
MKPHDSVRVVRRWCDVCTDPVCGCLNKPEGLDNMYLPSGCGPRFRELPNGMRLGNVVSSLDLSRAWVTIHR